MRVGSNAFDSGNYKFPRLEKRCFFQEPPKVILSSMTSSGSFTLKPSPPHSSPRVENERRNYQLTVRPNFSVSALGIAYFLAAFRHASHHFAQCVEATWTDLDTMSGNGKRFAHSRAWYCTTTFKTCSSKVHTFCG